MTDRLTRAELDRFAEHYRLDPAGVETMLEAAEAHPSKAETRRFFVQVLGIGGLLSLAASLVFFVAANWSRLEIFGRFLIVEAVLVAAGIVALVRPPPALAGRAALFMAYVATGALLALFGQTYQTGADVYELFLTWSLLGLPFVVLGNWSVLSAAWLVTLNVALLLFCGYQPAGGLFWDAIGRRPMDQAILLCVAFAVNLVLCGLAEIFRFQAVPVWVKRIGMSWAFLFGSWSAVVGIVDDAASGLAVVYVSILLALEARYALNRREDIYPLAVVMGTCIVIGTALIIETFEFADEGMLLIIAIWLIGTSTFAARFLVARARAWRNAGVSS